MIDEGKLQELYDSAGVPLNDKQRAFIEHYISSNRHSVLLGVAGVGKSLILNLLKKYYGDEMAVLCSTGVSSQNLECSYGTAHAFLSLPLKVATDFHLKKLSRKCTALFTRSDKVKIIVIDEAFLLNSDNLHVIWKRIERFNKKQKSRKSRKIRLLLVGDPCQSLTIADEDLQQELKQFWGSHLMFKSTVWDRYNFETYVLDKVERQDDKVFKACLDVLRYNQVDRFNNCFKWLNQRYTNDIDPSWIYLSATNKTVDAINEKVLQSNPNPKFKFEPKINGDFNIKDTLVRENGVSICKDLKVMMINNDPEERWSNGSTGIVTLVNKEGCYVLMNHSGNTEYVTQHTWENKEVTQVEVIDSETNEISYESKETLIGEMACLPLLPCAAISIMKAQGLTIKEDFVIDLGQDYLYTWHKMGDFGTNFLYLALSRSSNINNVHLKQPINYKYVKVSQPSIDFWYKSVEEGVI
jgi:ATP-dependent DNA helicase PIF1